MGKLKDARGKLEDNFISKLLSSELREMIQNKEKEVQGSIESIKTQIRQIENLLTTMSNAEQAISSKIKDAAQSTVDVFL